MDSKQPIDLNVSNIGKILNLLGDVQNQWYELGLHLGVTLTVLEAIKSDCHNTRQRFIAMLKEWLKMIEPSWHKLVHALAMSSVGHANLALRIAKQFSIFLPAPSIVTVVSGGVAEARGSYSVICGVNGADGFCPSIQYQWFHDGKELDNSSTATLTFDPLRTNHVGDYSCFIKLTSPFLKHPLTANSNVYTIAPSHTATMTPHQEDLEEKFSDLSNRTFDVISKEKISVQELKVRLSSLPVKNKPRHREFISTMLSKLSPHASLGDVWSTLNLYWNFLNYLLLESIIKRYGHKSLKADFEDFKKQVKAFRCATRICDFFKELISMNEHLSKDHLQEVVTKLNKKWEECTLQDVEASRELIAQKLFVPPSSLIFLNAAPSSVKIVWAVLSSAPMSSLKNNIAQCDFKKICEVQGILSITVGGVTFEYTPPITGSSEAYLVQSRVSTLESLFIEIEESMFETIFKLRNDVFSVELNTLFEQLGGCYKILYEKVLDFERNSSVSAMWLRLSDYWDFYNYGLLEQLIVRLGNESLVRRFENYSKNLADFKKKTRLSCFWNYFYRVPTHMPTFGEFSKCTVEISHDPVLEGLESLERSISAEFDIPIACLFLTDYKPRLWNITWAIPSVFASYDLKSVSSQFLQKHGVLSARVGDTVIKRHLPTRPQFRSISLQESQARRDCNPLMLALCKYIVRPKRVLVIGLAIFLLLLCYIFISYI